MRQVIAVDIIQFCVAQNISYQIDDGARLSVEGEVAAALLWRSYGIKPASNASRFVFILPVHNAVGMCVHNIS